MTVKSELIAIRQKHKGILKAEDVHKWAKANPKSALYRQIEWNTSKAAREFQLWQIRRLIMVHVVTEEGEPQMVSLTIDRKGRGGGYRAIDDVLSNKQLSAVMLGDAIQELERVRIKYLRVNELTSVWSELDAVKLRTARRLKKVA